MNQVFHAYTDLLLHEIGEGLADGRPDFAAGPRDWRTPALWGLGLSQTASGSTAMLHDGRARSVTEAILWHGGEAERSRQFFRAMTTAERQALVKFVEAIWQRHQRCAICKDCRQKNRARASIREREASICAGFPTIGVRTDLA